MKKKQDFLFLFCFLFCLFVVEPQLHADLLLHFSFLITFVLFCCSFFVVVHRSSSSVLSFCVCVFGQTLTNAQFHTNVYKYVKYKAESCCESVMIFFFDFFFFF